MNSLRSRFGIQNRKYVLKVSQIILIIVDNIASALINYMSHLPIESVIFVLVKILANFNYW